jgi:TPR repeat protein
VKSRIAIAWLLAAAILPAEAFAAPTASRQSRDVVKAIARGDCDGALQLANEGLRSNDPQTIFTIGRMLAEGVCIEPDVAGATAYFSHAAAQGLPAAEIEYGLQVGLGAGAEQSYERAGDLCQKGGLEHQGGGSSLYSLGYLCTVRGLVSRLLRETLPRGAILPGSRAARVSFNPVSGSMQIRATPRVATVPDTTTGTFVQRPLIDAESAIDKAWRDALSSVPKPDAALLENQGTELSLDLDMSIEAGGGGGRAHLQPNSQLMPNDIPVQASGPGLPHH